jgi:protein O-mannosyl-transferase
MIFSRLVKQTVHRRWFPASLLILGFVLTTAIYWPGLSGSFFFDDNPNIVENKGVQPTSASLPSLINAALSSPSSEFKRPLSSLTFAANYLLTGLDPYWMKLTNLLIHLLNGWLVFLLARALIDLTQKPPATDAQRAGIIAAVIACGWMVLPINLTGVLYVVQRMESLANLFVLMGLIGYVKGRKRMLAQAGGTRSARLQSDWIGLGICAASIAVFTLTGLLAKETAVMLPLYALVIEWILFGFRKRPATPSQNICSRDWRLISLYAIGLLIPLIIGLAWLLPGLLRPESWANRNFTLGTRLLSEARIVVDYIIWSLLPTPDALSFYHDNFVVSTDLWHPWTTLPSILVLAAAILLVPVLRRRWPLVSLGIALFFGAHLLTATILPLELVYEHRNYFASFGLLLAIVPILITAPTNHPSLDGRNLVLARRTALAGLMLLWSFETATTAIAWGSPLALAETLAARAPDSPRAEYELGRTYIIYSHYDPSSPFTAMAYAPLESAAALANSSILPQQALIFMNSRMHLPLKDAWWDSMIEKLKSRPSTVQDESSLGALTECARDHDCDLPPQRMIDAYLAALSHPNPSARLLAMYGDYAWNVIDDRNLGERMIVKAIRVAPNEPAYRITLIRMLAAQNRTAEANDALKQLELLNVGGRLDSTLSELRKLPGIQMEHNG